MKIDICTVKFEDLELSPRSSEKIRGYIGNKYIENDLFHNHNDNKFIYRYPLVQYKVIKNKPIIIGLLEGTSAVKKLALIEEELIIDDKKLETYQKEIIDTIDDFGECEDYVSYEFITPWIALSQKNASIYKDLSQLKREEQLKKILIGNIISMCKGMNYTVKSDLICWLNLKEKHVNLKGVRHTAFIGEFKVNFKIPDYLGLGKSVSRGFGTIKAI